VTKRTALDVLCIHGAGGGGWEWGIWQRVLGTRGWRVLAHDLMPGSAGLAATHFADYATQVHYWRSALAEPGMLVGASLGGLLALQAAAQMPPAALVLINPLPPAGFEQRPAQRTYADIVPWGRERSLRRTQRALVDGDAAACLFAWRRWRDESGQVLNEAASIQVEIPRCPILLLASEHDDVPPAVSRALAAWLGADLRMLRESSHVGPLLGRAAPTAAALAADWYASQ